MKLKTIKESPYQNLAKYAIPSVIGMLLTSLITIVDGAFVSRNIGDNGLAAVNLGIPILYLFLGITIMLGVGGSTLALTRLGNDKKQEANNTFMMTVTITLSTIIFLSVLLLLLLPFLLKIFNLSEIIQQYMLQYYKTILLFYPLMMINIIFGMFIRGEGKPEIFMLVTLFSNIINIFLDYLFIYKLSYGMKGAALASGIAILTGFIINIFYLANKKSFFSFHKPEIIVKDIKTTCFNGSSEFIGQLSMAITTALFNFVILRIMGITGVAAMTIIGYMGYIHNMIVTGIGQGMSPIISFSCGARNHEVVYLIKKCTQQIVFALGFLIMLFIIFADKLYISLFTSNIELISIVKIGLKIYSFAFLINGYNMISSFFFTSIGAAKESAIISAMRGLVILSLSIIILPLIFHDNGVWAAVPFTELLTFIVSFSLIKSCNLADTC